MEIGVKNLYMAAVAKTDGEITYATPTIMAKVIGINLTTEFAEAKLYADDQLDYWGKEFISGKISLNVSDLSNETLATLLGWKSDSDKVLYSGSAESEETPTFAIGFMSGKGGKQSHYVWIYDVQFSAPSESYETKGDQIKITTPTIEGVFKKRDSNGLWKADYVGTADSQIAQSWFSKVREFKEA